VKPAGWASGAESAEPVVVAAADCVFVFRCGAPQAAGSKERATIAVARNALNLPPARIAV